MFPKLITGNKGPKVLFKDRHHDVDTTAAKMKEFPAEWTEHAKLHYLSLQPTIYNACGFILLWVDEMGDFRNNYVTSDSTAISDWWILRCSKKAGHEGNLYIWHRIGWFLKTGSNQRSAFYTRRQSSQTLTQQTVRKYTYIIRKSDI